MLKEMLKNAFEVKKTYYRGLINYKDALKGILQCFENEVTNDFCEWILYNDNNTCINMLDDVYGYEHGLYLMEVNSYKYYPVI